MLLPHTRSFAPGAGVYGGSETVKTALLQMALDNRAQHGLALLRPHLCPSVVPRFVDVDRDFLSGPLRHLDFRHRAAAYLSGGAAEEGPLKLDGLALRPTAESHTIIAARVLRRDKVIPARCVFSWICARECKER